MLQVSEYLSVHVRFASAKAKLSGPQRGRSRGYLRNGRAFMTSISNRRGLARRALALLATSGACIGLGGMLGARPVGRMAGLPQPGTAPWLLPPVCPAR